MWAVRRWRSRRRSRRNWRSRMSRSWRGSRSRRIDVGYEEEWSLYYCFFAPCLQRNQFIAQKTQIVDSIISET